MVELINMSLYTGAILLYWKRYRKLDAYFIMLSAYVATSILCYLYSISGNSEYVNAPMLGYIYLFACIIISLSPYKGFSLNGKTLAFKDSPLLRKLTWMYIVSGILSLFYYIPSAVELVQSGEWGILRQMAYEGEVQLTHSFFEFLVKNIHGYLAPLGIVMCFYYLGKEDVKKYFIWLLWISWLFVDGLSGFAIASRSMVVALIFSVTVCIFLFRDLLSTRLISILISIMIGLISLIALYLISVSISRFGEEGAGDSVFFYLGHSMTAFSKLIFEPMHSYAWGDYSLSLFYHYFGIDATINDNALGLKLAGAFMTFVGGYYIDFGPVFTLIFVCVITIMLNSFTKKRVLHLSDMVIIVAFARIFMEGIFYIASGYLFAWIFTYLIYVIVRRTEK